MLAHLAALAVGIALLAFAADHFVLGSARMAGVLRVSPLVIGAVIVGFGTSAPELLVSGIAAWQGDLDVGVGNVVGSNVANLTLILGTAGVLVPITVKRGILRREAVLSAASVLVFAVLVQGGFSIVEGIVMLGLLAGALALVIRGAGRERGAALGDEVVEELDVGGHGLASESVRTLVGLAGTIAGAYALVWGAEGLADRFGLSGGFIGMSLVAVGTSLPELVTAIAAARHRQQELVVGNLLGSNLFNSLAVGGVIAVLAPGVAVEASLRTVGAGFMVVVALGPLAAMASARCVRRAEGALLLATFVAFLAVTYVAQPGEPGAIAGETAAIPGS